MRLTGLHFLLTYQCNFECEHCFVWGSPWQSGTMSLSHISQVLQQAQEMDSIEWIFFEGGEPFLYYAIMAAGIQRAKSMGFHVGVVSNAYWAISVEDALLWLKPLAGMIEDLSVSSDKYHYDEQMSEQAQNAVTAANQLKIPIGVISIAQSEEGNKERNIGMLPQGGAAVMYRGRAAEKLASQVAQKEWDTFTECPYEDLSEPGRIHLDPLGNLHICQGISIGNVLQTPLKKICAQYDSTSHPVCGPLLSGGPVALVKKYALAHAATYADACHCCYEARQMLRERFPKILTPDQMYGVDL